MSVVDTIYTFTFVSAQTGATLGDHYLGWVVADTGTYAVGQSFLGHELLPGEYDGTYVITGANDYNADLGDYYGVSHEDGMTYVTDYYDAGIQSYVPVSLTQPQPGIPIVDAPYGANYIGSEFGWAGNMTNFGLNSTTYALDAALS